MRAKKAKALKRLAKALNQMSNGKISVEKEYKEMKKSEKENKKK
jgi:hypothetical protein